MKTKQSPWKFKVTVNRETITKHKTFYRAQVAVEKMLRQNSLPNNYKIEQIDVNKEKNNEK